MPYSQFQKESLDHLGELLKSVMIRADKSILKSACHFRDVLLDFSADIRAELQSDPAFSPPQ